MLLVESGKGVGGLRVKMSQHHTTPHHTTPQALFFARLAKCVCWGGRGACTAGLFYVVFLRSVLAYRTKENRVV